MGALHEGHLALVREAQRQTDHVVVTLFVNPTQFAPAEDLAAYPRNEAADQARLAELGVDILFAPSTGEMYPDGFDTKVVVGGAARGLESEFRPHFFTGVATIVSKLLLAGLPDRAFFGEKDFQQLLVVKQLVRDLSIPTEIVGCPTLREPDGLALSSRNAYLAPDERARAPRLHAVLVQTAERLRAGDDAEAALAAGRRALADAGFAVNYLELRNAATLEPVRDLLGEPLRLLAAARLGRTRLIDNIAV
jgi:pantoate--beta-alanine ligase